MHINFRNKEPNTIIKSDYGCSQLFKNEKLGLDEYIKKFIKSFTKKNSDDNENHGDIREGVIGVVAPWGSGKSFFLNYLFCKLKDKYSVVYMDGSDYRNSENIELSVLKAIYTSNTVKEKLQKTALNIFKSVGKIVAKKSMSYIFKDKDGIGEVLEEVSNEAIDDFVDSFMETPQDKLKRELSKTAKDYPLVIIIDNLDRCDADFTLAFLTKIRSIFDIQNLLFIVAYDKIKIKNFISQKFGENNTSGFLRKYISAEFYLPNFNDSVKHLIEHFYDECKFNTLITKEKTDSTDKSSDDAVNFPIKTLEERYKTTDLTFRMIEQIIKNSSRVVEQNKEDYESSYKNVSSLFYIFACKYIDEDSYYNKFYSKTLESSKCNNCEKTSDCEKIQKQIELY